MNFLGFKLINSSIADDHLDETNLLLISYATLQTRKDDIEHKYCHVVQILDSERAGAWQLLQQCQEQAQQLKDLRQEVSHFNTLL